MYYINKCVKKRTITGYIRSNMTKIENMQFEGFYLKTIFEELKKDFPEDFSFKTFTDTLYKVRKKNSTSVHYASKAMLIQKLNAVSQTKTIEDTKNIISASIAIKNTDPFTEDS
jgi:hypothetical protein